MTRIPLGLALSLPILWIAGTAALAQTVAAPPPTPAAPPTATAPVPQLAPPAPGSQKSDAAVNGSQQSSMAQNAPPEGMVIETPNGFYLVRPGEKTLHRIDMGPGGSKPGPMARGPEEGLQAGGPQEGDGPMDEMAAEDGMQPPMAPQFHKPPRPPQPEGKGARFRIKTPSLTLGVKCPDDEPIRACVDAVSDLMAKAAAPVH